MSDKRSTATSVRDLVEELDEILVRRLEEIDAGQKRLRRLGVVLALLVMALSGISGTILLGLNRAGYFGAGATEIKAERFTLIDRTGTVRGSWALAEDGSTRLALHDKEGRTRLRLTVLDAGSPGFSLMDEAGGPRIVLGLLPDETSTLVFADKGGTARAVLGVSIDESATLVFADSDGTTRAGLGVGADGAASLTLPEEEPVPVASESD